MTKVTVNVGRMRAQIPSRRTFAVPRLSARSLSTLWRERIRAIFEADEILTRYTYFDDSFSFVFRIPYSSQPFSM
jgi:hypothetical protein